MQIYSAHMEDMHTSSPTVRPSWWYISLYSEHNTVFASQISVLKSFSMAAVKKRLAESLSRLTLGPKLSPCPFSFCLSLSVSWCPHVLRYWSSCWMGPSVHPLLIVWPLICLDSVTNRGCKERRAEGHPNQSGRSLAHFKALYQILAFLW